MPRKCVKCDEVFAGGKDAACPRCGSTEAIVVAAEETGVAGEAWSGTTYCGMSLLLCSALCFVERQTEVGLSLSFLGAAALVGGDRLMGFVKAILLVLVLAASVGWIWATVVLVRSHLAGGLLRWDSQECLVAGGFLVAAVFFGAHLGLLRSDQSPPAIRRALVVLTACYIFIAGSIIFFTLRGLK